jgi:hypothetical protein
VLIEKPAGAASARTNSWPGQIVGRARGVQEQVLAHGKRVRQVRGAWNANRLRREFNLR